MILTLCDCEWPCADGDYCSFTRQGSNELCLRLAKDGNERQGINDSIYYHQEDKTDTGELWNEIMSPKEITSNKEPKCSAQYFMFSKASIMIKLLSFGI
jgi:hypothetical protein